MRKVLVVDDNFDIRSLIQQALEMEGYSVLIAENGAAAKSLLSEGARPSLILLDLMMPVMDGKEFLQWKNSRLELKETPVVIISAVVSKEGLEGAKRFLRKPIDLNEMLDVVEACCG